MLDWFCFELLLIEDKQTSIVFLKTDFSIAPFYYDLLNLGCINVQRDQGDRNQTDDQRLEIGINTIG